MVMWAWYVGGQRDTESGFHGDRGLRDGIESIAVPAVAGSGWLGRTESTNTDTPAW